MEFRLGDVSLSSLITASNINPGATAELAGSLSGSTPNFSCSGDCAFVSRFGPASGSDSALRYVSLPVSCAGAGVGAGVDASAGASAGMGADVCVRLDLHVGGDADADADTVGVVSVLD